MTKFIELHYNNGESAKLVNTDSIVDVAPRYCNGGVVSGSYLTLHGAGSSTYNLSVVEDYAQLRSTLLDDVSRQPAKATPVKPAPAGRAYVNGAEAARLADVTYQTIWRWAAEGRITVDRTRPNRPMYLRSEVSSMNRGPHRRNREG